MRKFNRSSGKRAGGRSSGRSNRGDSGRSSDGYNRGDFGRSSRRGSGRRDRSSFEKPTMHEVTCDKCGQSCEVPFKPSSGKPVYCSDCFKKEGGSDSRGRRQDSRSSFRRESRPRQDKPSAELQQINEKLDKILEMLSD